MTQMTLYQPVLTDNEVEAILELIELNVQGFSNYFGTFKPETEKKFWEIVANRIKKSSFHLKY